MAGMRSFQVGQGIGLRNGKLRKSGTEPMKRRTLIYVALATLLGSACVAPRVSETDFTAGVGQPASQVAQWE